MSVLQKSLASVEAPNPGLEKALEWLRSGPKKLLIDGNWVASTDGKTFENINPATEEVLGLIEQAGANDVDLAVQAARRAFETSSWSGMNPHARARILFKVSEAIEKYGDELAYLETLDTGAPIGLSYARVTQIAEVFRYYAGWPSKIAGSVNPTDPTKIQYMLREPMGVCALINAWNVPLVMAATKLAPALACGNTAILKPAEQSPLSTLRLAEIIEEVGLPPGVMNILPGPGSSAGAAMAEHPDIDKIAFTGSTAVGRRILTAASGNMKKVTLELGGKSPNIIFPDANLDLAFEAAVSAFCKNSGQICSAGTRLFVHESILDEAKEKLGRIASTYTVGSPLDPDIKMGPLISEKQMTEVLGYVQAGKDEGARLEMGGSRVGNRGYFVEPTIFSQVGNKMKIAQEEIFGPVLSIISFKTEEEAVQQGNDTIYGLAAAVWTSDVGRAHRIARSLKSGRVWINTYAEGDPAMSFGGYKQSGFGREMGAESIDTYTQTKSVLARL